MLEIYEKPDNKIDLFSSFKLYEEPLKRRKILYLSWTIIIVFLLSIIVIHSTIYNSLMISILSILFLGIFVYFRYFWYFPFLLN